MRSATEDSAAGPADANHSRFACLPHIAQFFAGMTRAEEISRDVSRRQALIAPNTAMRSFLASQSRQEALHAAAFRAALRLASRRHSYPDPLARALDRFAARLHADLDAGWLEGSLIGLQGVLEGIGAVALGAPRTELASIGARFVPLRHVLLAQEESHHRHGLRWLARLSADRARDQGALRRSQREYADLGEEVVVASVEIFEGFDVEQRVYLDAGRAAIAASLDHATLR